MHLLPLAWQNGVYQGDIMQLIYNYELCVWQSWIYVLGSSPWLCVKPWAPVTVRSPLRTIRPWRQQHRVGNYDSLEGHAMYESLVILSGSRFFYFCWFKWQYLQTFLFLSCSRCSLKAYYVHVMMLWVEFVKKTYILFILLSVTTPFYQEVVWFHFLNEIQRCCWIH